MKYKLISLTFLALAAFSMYVEAVSEPQLTAYADASQQAHGLNAWWEKEVVSANVEIVFGGNTVVDGTFVFQAHGPKARYDRADGATIYFDGADAWITPPDAEDARGRFHVLTWPWFIMAPFKMQGDGSHLSDFQAVTVSGQEYHTFLQTFGSEVGDTPDDWYRFYINTGTRLIDAMSYIVTYGKDLEAANEQTSIIKYLDYESFDGAVISTRYEFWYWDQINKTYIGDAPKGTGVITDVHYLSSKRADFVVPPNARKLSLP